MGTGAQTVPNDHAKQKRWIGVQQNRLDKGNIEKLRKQTEYFQTKAERMRYPEFRKQHLFVGSGVIEAACKTVIGSRLKRSGMFWSRTGAGLPDSRFYVAHPQSCLWYGEDSPGKFMTYVPPVIQILLALVVMTAGVYDIRWRRIPNWLTLTGALLGVGLNSFLYETSGLWFSLKGLGLALLIYFPLYAIRAMGAGDAKLMGTVGAIVGPMHWLGIFIISAVLGGVFAIALILTTGRARRTFANVGFLIRELAFFRAPYMKKEELDVRSPKAFGLPHGAVIALGSMAWLAALAIWTPR